MKHSPLILFLLLSATGYSQPSSSIVRFNNPNSVNAASGYSHVAIVDLGNCEMLVLSGQVALDHQGQLVGKNDLSKQTEQVFLNIRNILFEHGGSMDDVIKIGIYMKDVSQIQSFREARDKFINLENPPASTLVGVQSLFRDDILLEVEATAIIPKR